MIPKLLANRSFIQICWIVPDIKVAIDHWLQSTGTGPWFTFEKMTIDEAQYRGKPVELELSVAIAQAGDIQIELVQQRTDGPSAYRDLVPAGKTGMHHMALYCNDYDADFAAYTESGAAAAFTGKVFGNRVAYMDTSATVGYMVELIEGSEGCEQIFAQVREASKNWDGKDPIRKLG
jgi:hypothetical protein